MKDLKIEYKYTVVYGIIYKLFNYNQKIIMYRSNSFIMNILN